MSEENKTDEKQAPKAGDIVGQKDGVIYVVHPVSAEQKAKIKKKGKIIDARFYVK